MKGLKRVPIYAQSLKGENGDCRFLKTGGLHFGHECSLFDKIAECWNCKIINIVVTIGEDRE